MTFEEAAAALWHSPRSGQRRLNRGVVESFGSVFLYNEMGWGEGKGKAGGIKGGRGSGRLGGYFFHEMGS